MYQIGIDVGGTFTDFVLRDDSTGKVTIGKVPSTPEDPSRAGLSGLLDVSRAAGASAVDINRVLHGTTVATNLMLEKKGATVGLITTGGFRDILHIGRKKRPLNFSNYQDVPWQSSPLVPRHLRLTVPERVRAPDGSVDVPLDEEAAGNAVRQLAGQGVEAISICFLFSFLNPAHELRVKQIAAEICPQVFVTCSHEVSPLHREYERFSTTALNAYVGPATARYIERFDEAVAEAGASGGLRLMTSAGGLVGSRIAKEKPVSLLLSGPVGALIKGVEIGRQIGHSSVITLDVGGTSADVGVAPDGRLLHKHILDTKIGDYDAMVPMVDLATIGAGGGSIASVDEAGMFSVGPRSAGARPGPACFGFGGDEPTVTDALVALGWFREETMESSGITVHRDRAQRAIEDRIAKPLGIGLEEAALGIYRIVCRNMIDAIRLGSISKGFDPRDFVLIAFGGAGSSFVADIANELSMARALIPPHPGVGAAAGLLATDIRYEYMASCWGALDSIALEELAQKAEGMAHEASRELRGDGFADADIEILYQCDCRYRGQGYELTVDVPGSFSGAGWRSAVAEAFHRAHEQRYLRRFEDKPIQVINIRAIGVGPVDTAGGLPELSGAGDAAAPVASRPCVFAGGDGWQRLSTAFYDRAGLPPESILTGPAVIEQQDTTTILPPGFQAITDRFGNLLIAPEAGNG